MADVIRGEKSERARDREKEGVREKGREREVFERVRRKLNKKERKMRG